MGRDLPKLEFDGFMIGLKAYRAIGSAVGMRGRSSGSRGWYLKVEVTRVRVPSVVVEVRYESLGKLKLQHSTLR